MTKERYAHELSRFGTVYEVTGIAAPDTEQRDAFRRDLMEWLTREGFIASATSDNRCIQVFVVPHDNWPELDLEWCDEGQLLLCDTGPSSRPALPHFIEFLGARGWSLRVICSRSDLPH